MIASSEFGVDRGGVCADFVIDDFDGVVGWEAGDLGENGVREVILWVR